LKVTDAGKTRVFGAGNLVFYRINFLSKFTKIPNEKEPFRFVTVIFDRDILLKFSQQYNVVYDNSYPVKDPVLQLKKMFYLRISIQPFCLILTQHCLKN